MVGGSHLRSKAICSIGHELGSEDVYDSHACKDCPYSGSVHPEALCLQDKWAGIIHYHVLTNRPKSYQDYRIERGGGGGGILAASPA